VAAFEADGVGVSLDEIARRAGVGAGTVHRHFPTKAALVDAAIAEPVNVLASRAAGLIDSTDPTAAFFVFVEELVVNGAAAHAFADRLRSDADDPEMAIAEPLARLRAGLEALLGAAQRDGGVRGDIDAGRLDAFVAAAHAAYLHPTGGVGAISLLTDGLRTHRHA
jgi:AcrR family transcriptional regulator